MEQINLATRSCVQVLGTAQARDRLPKKQPIFPMIWETAVNVVTMVFGKTWVGPLGTGVAFYRAIVRPVNRSCRR